MQSLTTPQLDNLWTLRRRLHCKPMQTDLKGSSGMESEVGFDESSVDQIAGESSLEMSGAEGSDAAH